MSEENSNQNEFGKKNSVLQPLSRNSSEEEKDNRNE